ncbi:hypothetical protein GSI_14788 [Ganoderma sinense ZZ0214-1]|uniref:Uncharacterized protein n=1 Tax=Ganoderma sinense ZZ0214-1 TaxID=1077348 RepID=A0A2G8RPP6_9APHY|nr:hypothetical protein GSI_14788 [Ganoderma sinense ZZ0214-1]
MKHWPIHAQSCDRDVTRDARTVEGVQPVYPYVGEITLSTRSAVDPLPPVSIDHMPAPAASGSTYDYVIYSFYAKHNGDGSRILPVNVSPTPMSKSGDALLLSHCFQSTSVSRSFIICYEGRYNPNRELVRLTQSVDMILQRPWYGSVVVTKFRSRACTSYVDITFDDVVHIRDYFAYFA